MLAGQPTSSTVPPRDAILFRRNMDESTALETAHDAWTEKNWRKTLDVLRRDYPKYSDNELYVIWCHVNGRVPFDRNGKINVEQWQMHAEEDGKHTPTGFFKVSRPLWGRALKAAPGRAKPKQAPRGSKQRAAEAEEVEAAPVGKLMSQRAIELAKAYDHASRILVLLLDKRREARTIAEQLRALPKGVLVELAADGGEAADALREQGLI